MSIIDRIRDRLFGFQTCGVSETKQTEMMPPIGKFSEENADKFPERVLFVCSGNICRSAYGAAKFLKMISQNHPQVKVASAGTLQLFGRSAASNMIQAAEARGIDLRTHSSQGLSRMLIKSSDTIFAMAPEHREGILHIDPEASSKIVMLGMFLQHPAAEITDPMGRDFQAYCTAAEQIDEALNNWYKRFG